MRLTTILLFISTFAHAQISGSGGQYDSYVKKSATDSIHALLWLPEEYTANPTKKYPLMVFFHGIGEIGSTTADLAKIWNNSNSGGPSYEITKGRKMSFINPVTGVREYFIVICPQSNEGVSTNKYQTPFILEDIYRKYRVDTNRVTLTCISQGGKAAMEYSGGIAVTPYHKMAAQIPMSATLGGGDLKPMGDKLYADHVGIWGFGDPAGDTHGANTGAVIYYYNLNEAGKGHFTNYVGGHGGWFLKYDTTYRETFTLQGASRTVNIYEWALTQTASPVDAVFTVSAGADQTITLPTSSTTLSATAQAAVGKTITGYAWAKISGPGSQSFGSGTSATTTITGLQAGTYQIKVTATQSDAATLSDTLSIVVTSIPTGCNGRRITVVKGGDGGKYISGRTFPMYPGDTLVLKANVNNWAYFSIEDMHGSAACPIVVINEGGQINIGAMAAKHCTYIKFTGSGSADQYGFYMTSPSGSGTAWSISGRSRCIEIERSNVYHETYIAWVKHEADCADSLKYPNWYIDSISFHDNKGRDIAQDGLYFGSTSPNGLRAINCSGTTISPIPLRLSNIKIYNNIIDSCGRTAIQLSGADVGNNEIYNNTISRAGFELNQSQGSGIISGGDTKVYIHDNVISQTFQNGIFILGAGLNRVENNDIDSSGYLGSTFNALGQPCAILLDTRVTTPTTINTSFLIKSNTVGRVATADGKHIVIMSTQNTFNTDNVVCGNLTQTGGPADVYVAPDITYTSTDCVPGAANIPPIANAGRDTAIIVSTVQLMGTGTDADGTIVSYSWGKVSGGAYTIDNASIASPTLTNLSEGVYVFRLTVVDNIGASNTNDVTVSVLASDVQQIRIRGFNRIQTVE